MRSSIGRLLLALALGSGALLAACTGPPAASDETVLHLIADDLRFDRDRLAVEAGRAFAIVLDNRHRGIPHNVSIYADAAATEPIVIGEISMGEARTTVAVPPLEEGEYHFRCDVHRLGMTGRLSVGG